MPQGQSQNQSQIESQKKSHSRTPDPAHATPAEGDLARSRQLTDELEFAVHALESRLGPGLDVRRVRTDLDHLRESLRLLQDTQNAAHSGSPHAGSTQYGPIIEIPDTPYDPELWRDAGDEGIGSR